MNEPASEFEGAFSVEKEVYKQHVLEFEDWKTTIITGMKDTVEEEYEELSTLLNRIEASNDDLEDTVFHNTFNQSESHNTAQTIS